ncbi:hypothetical protein V8G54_023485 [Vigna mungo]|uniref:Uncharacterized protein n=1 Tax=Vigna mungo TaxID=3915 RepID=A0AAQ3RP95_VIGMU
MFEALDLFPLDAPYGFDELPSPSINGDRLSDYQTFSLFFPFQKLQPSALNAPDFARREGEGYADDKVATSSSNTLGAGYARNSPAGDQTLLATTEDSSRILEDSEDDEVGNNVDFIGAWDQRCINWPTVTDYDWAPHEVKELLNGINLLKAIVDADYFKIVVCQMTERACHTKLTKVKIENKDEGHRLKKREKIKEKKSLGTARRRRHQFWASGDRPLPPGGFAARGKPPGGRPLSLSGGAFQGPPPGGKVWAWAYFSVVLLTYK